MDVLNTCSRFLVPWNEIPSKSPNRIAFGDIFILFNSCIVRTFGYVVSGAPQSRWIGFYGAWVPAWLVAWSLHQFQITRVRNCSTTHFNVPKNGNWFCNQETNLFFGDRVGEGKLELMLFLPKKLMKVTPIWKSPGKVWEKPNFMCQSNLSRPIQDLLKFLWTLIIIKTNISSGAQCV